MPAVIYALLSALRTRGSWVQILPGAPTFNDLGHLAGGFFVQRREFVSTPHDAQGGPAIHPLRQVVGGEVRIPLHHLRRRPSAEFLQHIKWRSILGVPTCPGVPQIVPPEARRDAGAFYSLPPCLGCDLPDGVPRNNSSEARPVGWGCHPAVNLA